MAKAFVEQFVASYAKPPEMIVLDMDHSEDRTHGQQELAVYNHHYKSHCYLPLFLFEGLSGKFITAALRPGKRPRGAENAMIIKRVLKRLREHWPETRILLRGDAHFANVELMQLALGDNPRFVVTSLEGPTPEMLYTELYCALGQDENFIKMMKNDLASDPTSDCRFAANHMRLFFSCAAYVLHHALRSELLQGNELARAQPSTVIIKLFKLAVRVVQYKDRVKLHLPSSCTVKDLLQTITERLSRLPRPPLNSS